MGIFASSHLTNLPSNHTTSPPLFFIDTQNLCGYKNLKSKEPVNGKFQSHTFYCSIRAMSKLFYNMPVLINKLNHTFRDFPLPFCVSILVCISRTIAGIIAV